MSSSSNRPPERRQPSRRTNPAADQGRKRGPSASARKHPASSLKLRQLGTSGQWELIDPPCVAERQADLEEVRQMLSAGEDEIAADELRYLLEDCRDFVEAHRLLGEIAAADNNLPLARAHFGYAYQIGVGAFPPAGLRGTLPYERPANRPFLEAGKGLVWSLVQLGKPAEAAEVLQTLMSCDPTDPLGVRGLLPE